MKILLNCDELFSVVDISERPPTAKEEKKEWKILGNKAEKK